MIVKIYNQEGKETGILELPVEVFGLKMNKDLVHQAVVTQMANSRQVLAHAKDRSEARGGGRKPWRQKGTGRARHGSIRSPIWRGGGVTFGPTKARVFAKKINKKMKRKALLIVLSGKAKDNELIVLDDLQLKTPKTKEMAKVIDNLTKIKKDISVSGGKRGVLIVLAKKDENIINAVKNIPKIDIIGAGNLNVVDLLAHKYLVVTKEGIRKIKELLFKVNNQSPRLKRGSPRAANQNTLPAMLRPPDMLTPACNDCNSGRPACNDCNSGRPACNDCNSGRRVMRAGIAMQAGE